jgi:hypothetical protein
MEPGFRTRRSWNNGTPDLLIKFFKNILINNYAFGKGWKLPENNYFILC